MKRILSCFCSQPVERAKSNAVRSVGSLLLLVLVFAVYRPILPGEFLMDDWRLINANNPLVDGEMTPFNIWFQTDFTLSSFALWLEYLAWGHAPGWYHVVNLLLHAAGAWLVWRVLSALKVPGAWLAAALFAVHPVCVNSVARVAEIKNTLSLPFFLLSFLAYLNYEKATLYPAERTSGEGTGPTRLPPSGRTDGATAWYVVALLAFVAALMAKTSTVMLPVILVACAAWQRGRVRRKDGIHIAPFFVLAVAFGLMSIWFQKNQALFSAGETLAPQSFMQRFAVAGHVFVFYLSKALWPVHLSLVYPKWDLNSASLMAYWPHVVLCVGAGVCWWFRRGWGRHVLFAIGCYAIALFPALGFFDSQFLVLWQVSDHLQYLPLVAPVALFAAALATCIKPRAILIFTSILLLAAVSFLAYQRASVFVSEEKLMRDSIAKNPSDWFARNDLGTLLARQNDIPAALEQFEKAYEIQPNDPKVNSNLGHALAITGKWAEADARYRSSLAEDPTSDDTRRNFADLLRREGRIREAIAQYEAALAIQPDTATRLNLAQLYYQAGDIGQAKREFQAVLYRHPDDTNALNNYAWLLATCGEDRERDGALAVRLATRACALTRFKQARLTGTLAAAYAEAGRFDDAVAMARRTIQLANDSGDQPAAAISNQLLQLYLEHRAYHQATEGR